MINNKIKHYVKEIISFLILLFIISNIVSYYNAMELNKTKLDSNISLYSTLGYDKVDKPILVHFWGSWCPICKVEAPNIQSIYKSNKYNVITIAVNSGNDTAIQKYLDDNNLDFKVINNKDSFYANEFNIKVFPTTLIYDKDKNLIFSEVGYTSTLGLKLRLWWVGL